MPAADPGRLHEEGRVVRDALEEARRQVATLVGAAPREVVFTSGGTEAINAAVWGATRQHPGAPVLFANVEHSAVRDASARSAPVEVIPVDVTARLDAGALESRLAAKSLPRPALVHCQWANHEVGTLQPVHEVVELCRAAGVPVHVDAAAACGHVPIDLAELGADLVSLSAHKIRRRCRRRRTRHTTREQVRASHRRGRAGAGATRRARSDTGPGGLRGRGGGAERGRRPPPPQ